MLDSAKTWSLVVGMAIAFTAVSVFVLETAHGRSEALFPVWAAFVIGLEVTNLLVLVTGLRTWSELDRWREARRSTLLLAFALVVVIVGLSAASQPITGTRDWRGFVLVSSSLVAAVPAAASFIAIVRAARAQSGGTFDARAQGLSLMHRLLQRLLTATGSLVALTTRAPAKS